MSLKRLKQKMAHTRPECGEDNSKERYRYIQWISDSNAIREAADEQQNREIEDEPEQTEEQSSGHDSH